MQAALRTSVALVVVLGVPGPVRAAEVLALISAPVDAYREALDGFESSLVDAKVRSYNLNGDIEKGTRYLENLDDDEKPDLIFAVGVWALEAVLAGRGDIPTVYAMVLNPESVVGAKAANVTGASMNTSVDDNLALIEQLGPSVRRVGVVYSEAKTGALVQEAREIAASKGVELLAREVDSAKAAIKALDELLEEKIDAFWFIPDETILAPAVSKHVFLVFARNKVPVLGLSERQAELGALLTLSFASSEDIGKQAGELASRVLAGSQPADVPHTTARQTTLTVNLKAAKKLGLEIPQSILVAANELIE